MALDDTPATDGDTTGAPDDVAATPSGAGTDRAADGSAEESGERVLVIGVGNPLVEDEGVGVRVAEELMSAYAFPGRVTVLDAGTMGMGMLQLFRDHDRLVVIDALDGTGEPPGTLMRLDPDSLATTQVMHSLHDVKLSDVLETAAFMGARPRVEFIGVQVASMRELVTELTPDVAAAVPRAISAVLALLAELDVEPLEDEEPASAGDARIIRAIRTHEPMRPPDPPSPDPSSAKSSSPDR